MLSPLPQWHLSEQVVCGVHTDHLALFSAVARSALRVVRCVYGALLRTSGERCESVAEKRSKQRTTAYTGLLAHATDA
jgi:hypothetical protein